MKNNAVLLKTLLLSTSQANVYRHTGDRKKRGRIIGNFIGLIILYLLLMAYCLAICIGYGQYGLIGGAPVMCALVISSLAFIFTLFKTNGDHFAFREYDMLMSLPFETRAVAACKFLYMYIKSLPWYVSISCAMMIGYGIYAHPSVIVYPVWILLSLFLPVIPMLAAAFLGFLIAKVSSGFRRKNSIQTALTFLFVLFCFSLRFILEDVFRNDRIQSVLESAEELTTGAARIYLPAGWFAEAVTGGTLSDGLLLIGVSTLLFGVVFYIVGNSYRNINSALRSHASGKSYKIGSQKQAGAVRAIAFKEYKRLTGSTTYMVNGIMGEVLAVLLGITVLIFGFDRIIAIVTQGAPVDAFMLQPAIPLIVYFLISMVATTTCSPSLEGKNYWILQSLPIEKKTVYQGKMLFNMILTVPTMVFTTLCLCISAKAPVIDTLLYLVLGFALSAFSTAWGCVCGIRHMRLDWENEVEVIKQGSAVAIYLLPNMFIAMGLTVLSVWLGTRMDHRLLALILILAAGLSAALSYRRVIKLSRRS